MADGENRTVAGRIAFGAEPSVSPLPPATASSRILRALANRGVSERVSTPHFASEKGHLQERAGAAAATEVRPRRAAELPDMTPLAKRFKTPRA